MADFFIGAIAVGGLLLLLDFARRKKLGISMFMWTVTVMGFAYGVFVLEVVVSFLKEGMAKGALVMGMILGIVALVWGILLGRFVFSSPKKLPLPEARESNRD